MFDYEEDTTFDAEEYNPGGFGPGELLTNIFSSSKKRYQECIEKFEEKYPSLKGKIIIFDKAYDRYGNLLSRDFAIRSSLDLDNTKDFPEFRYKDYFTITPFWDILQTIERSN